MNLVAFTNENFRGYCGRERIELQRFTSFVGRNDVGKSILLYALNIFLNKSNKPDQNEVNISGRGKTTGISCELAN